MLAGAAALFVAITAARFLVEGGATGITFLYVLPISIVALELGRWAGVGAALLALALFTLWYELAGEQEGVSAVAYTSRTAVFLLIGWLNGYLGERVRRLGREAAALARHFEVSHDMLCTADFKGYFVQLNDAWEETLGWTNSTNGRDMSSSRVQPRVSSHAEFSWTK